MAQFASQRSRLNGIKHKWTTEGKVNKSDVTWLLERAELVETMLAADTLRRTGNHGGDADFLRGLFGT